MTQIVPSQIVDFINSAFDPLEQTASFNESHIVRLRGLSDLLNELDRALWPKGNEIVYFVTGAAGIRALLEALTRKSGYSERYSDFNKNPVYHIWKSLKGCPDSVIPPSISGLDFVSDAEYRAKLRQELASVEVLFQDKQWKATMVMAGSLIEALLFDQLEKTDRSKINAAIANVEKNNVLIKFKSKKPEDWVLIHYVSIASELKLISKDTETQALLLLRQLNRLIYLPANQRWH